jgi:hypothetical protein
MNFLTIRDNGKCCAAIEAGAVAGRYRMRLVLKPLGKWNDSWPVIRNNRNAERQT